MYMPFNLIIIDGIGHKAFNVFRAFHHINVTYTSSGDKVER